MSRRGSSDRARRSEARLSKRNRDADTFAASNPVSAAVAVIEDGWAWARSMGMRVDHLYPVFKDAEQHPIDPIEDELLLNEAKKIVAPAAHAESVEEPGISRLTRALEARARSLDRRHILAFTDQQRKVELLRSPGLLDLTVLSAVEVDGEPFVSAVPSMLQFRRARQPAPLQRWFSFVGPASIHGSEVGDVVIRTLAKEPFGRDERSPIRGDVYRVAVVAFALSGTARIPVGNGAVFLGGGDTEANRTRWWNATRVLRALTVTVNERTGEWRTLAAVEPCSSDYDTEVAIGPPRWWTGKGDPWRFAGAVWRRQLDLRRNSAGAALFRSGLHRTIAGIEAALSWSQPTAGRGEHARTPVTLTATVPGGPGPEKFLPWREVLMVAGEHVSPDVDPGGTEHKRYERRVAALRAAGYEARGKEPAPAGDTVEIVEVQRGGRAREAGIIVRASARLCAAVADHKWIRVQASQVFGRPQRR